VFPCQTKTDNLLSERDVLFLNLGNYGYQNIQNFILIQIGRRISEKCTEKDNPEKLFFPKNFMFPETKTVLGAFFLEHIPSDLNQHKILDFLTTHIYLS
jgi:hypothetical protein